MIPPCPECGGEVTAVAVVNTDHGEGSVSRTRPCWHLVEVAIVENKIVLTTA